MASRPNLPDARRQLASLPIAVLLLGPDQTIASVNPAAEQFLGQSARRLVGRSLHHVIEFADERLVDRIHDSDAPLSARAVDVIVLGHALRRIDVTFAPVADEPGWQMLTLHDQVATDAMGEGIAARDEVLRAPEILAHEIKNPLAGIRGAAQLLARKVGPAQAPLTTLIADEVDRIAKLIDQMQSLSRRTIEPVAPCNLHEAVRHASAILSAAADATVRIEEEFDPSLPAVLGSASGLVQVLINLLSNAREACREVPAPRVRVRTRFAAGLQLQTTAKGKPVRLPIEVRVSDNGPGIDPAVRDLVFEPFVTTKKSGQGLGLALVRKLVGDMNGRITYERDDAGGWTHFRVHLPVATEPTAQGRAAAIAADAG